MMEENTFETAIFDIVMLSVAASGCAVSFSFNSWFATMTLLFVVWLFLSFCVRYPSDSIRFRVLIAPVIVFFIAAMTAWLSPIDASSATVYGVTFAIVFGATLYLSRRSVIDELPRD